VSLTGSMVWVLKEDLEFGLFTQMMEEDPIALWLWLQ
jgi:hypothetical protein